MELTVIAATCAKRRSELRYVFRCYCSHSSPPMERTLPLLLLCFANHHYCVALAGSK
nr:hypothetical protein Iba_chr03aCG0220 [Ipomoea batatas]